MKINITKTHKSRIDETEFENLGFGEVFSDHMFSMDYRNGEWTSAQIIPFGNIEILPSLCSLHYGQVVFEGLKAFRTKNGICLFRPEKYHERLNRSCLRLCIPEIDYEIFIEGLTELLKLDKNWIPEIKGHSLYIRPFIFATDSFLGVKISKTYRFMIITSPVGAYYREGFNPIRLKTSGKYARAVEGGLGASKTPANYAASLLPAEEAKKNGFSQVLWLDGFEKKYIEESGAMNVFFLMDDELVTPSLDSSILEGVTRNTVIHIAREWGMDVHERRISIDEVLLAASEGRLKEVFGTGTAAVISPIGEIQHNDILITINGGKIGMLSKKLYDEITGIQHGEKDDEFGWCHLIR
ncbi:MAG: branched-chain amino acid aminotransferase [Candidatus Methanoperedens sp.]|nr:branched-chain amino acid aminotransferase [Candidatus Methanoperedens sp.]MCZ7358900.1 branched-chain amino acid aminotransferase [Candidatus Methanoperedens sp.]HLB72218.1 branched-chain amino acid aminotransferase [Candidatus Methanoperedens sp.]